MKKNFFSLLAVMLMALTANAQHEYVDLGLPSGTLWATCNIGANSPEETGDLFAWGETETKSEYTEENYSFNLNTYDPVEVLTPAYDAATYNWDNDWQMPSPEQCTELAHGEYTTIEVTILNGVKVAKVTSKSNGNSIFLPNGDYWTNSLHWDGSFSFDTDIAYALFVSSSHISVSSDYRYEGYLIRPVRTQYTISNIPNNWKVNGTKVTNGTYEATPGAEVIFTPKNIPAGKKIKSIKAVKK